MPKKSITLESLDNKIDTNFDILDKKIDTKFDILDNKIDTKFDILDKKIKNVQFDIVHIKHRLDNDFATKNDLKELKNEILIGMENIASRFFDHHDENLIAHSNFDRRITALESK